MNRFMTWCWASGVTLLLLNCSWTKKAPEGAVSSFEPFHFGQVRAQVIDTTMVQTFITRTNGTEYHYGPDGYVCELIFSLQFPEKSNGWNQSFRVYLAAENGYRDSLTFNDAENFLDPGENQQWRGEFEIGLNTPQNINVSLAFPDSTKGFWHDSDNPFQNKKVRIE